MKTLILPVFFALCVLNSNKTFAQACPTIINSTFRINTDANNPCLRTISIDYVNPTNGPKRISVFAVLNGVTMINDCVVVSGDRDEQKTYVSEPFTACAIINFYVIITPYNGVICGVGGCEPYVFAIGESTLPVIFSSFTATRTNATVQLKWETATEINNKGFAIERSSNGSWMEIGFVNTKAFEGNSSTSLSYQFSDINNIKGISQYRIRQVDVDGKAKFSEVRAVRSEDLAAKTIAYPNPSQDGKVTVVYTDASARNISLTDMTGRTLKQWNNFTSNTLQVTNLTPGMYTIRSISMASNEQTTEKIIVNGR